MNDNRIQLATLIASRICHDLISPVGAISNGLELVSLSGTLNNGPEMSLISESCDSANARIRFFRMAYGAANETALVATAEIHSILEAMTRGTRLRIDWKNDRDAPRREVQLAFLGIQCVEVALQRGGQVEIDLSPGRVSLTARADRIYLKPDLWRHLDAPRAPAQALGDALDIAPAHVQFALLPLLAGDHGRKPSFTASETQLQLVV